MVEKILALSAEGYPDAKIARSLTEEGFRAARSVEGIPAGFVSEVRRQHRQSSVFQRLRSREKLEGSWTVRGLAKELEVSPNRIYNLIESGVLATERHQKTGNHLIADDPELIAGLRRRLTANARI
jgi:hypothetical protein